MNETTNYPKSSHFHIDTLGGHCAILLLRLWLGIRSVQAGLEKYAGKIQISKPTIVNGVPDPNGTETTMEIKAYALENYSGIPSSLSGKFKSEPFINEFFLGVFSDWLGPLLIVVGLCVLFGLATRLSLLAMGLIYTSLTYGLILLNQPSGIAWLGTHIVLIVVTLLFAGYNRLELGNLLADRFGLVWLRNK